MLAALTLLVLTLYFSTKRREKKGRSVLPLFIPFILVTAVALSALVSRLIAFWQADNRFLASVAWLMLGLTLFMLFEGIRAYRSRGASLSPH